MTVGSLFAGIGGFDLGFERAGFEIVWQVEIDEYCRRVLERHFPRADRSVIDVREAGKHNLKPVDVICMGFPCQDISLAGKRAGIDGKNSGLWREGHRVVCELRPRIVVVENVAALLIGGIERVLADLASGGYRSEWECLPLGAFGAHFLRDRVFIVAQDSQSSCCGPQRGRPRPTGAWSEQQFERLLRDQIQLALPAGRNGRICAGVPNRMERLHALGNSVSPEQTFWIAERIKATQEGVSRD